MNRLHAQHDEHALSAKPSLAHAIDARVRVLTVTTAAISTITIATISGHRVRAMLQERSTRIAERLQLQLRPIIARNDRAAAQEILDAFASDRDLDGLGVYSQAGDMIAGRGRRPERLPAGNENVDAGKHHIIVAGDEIGALAQSLNRMLMELNRVSAENAQLV